jgi:hypothetical protein
LKASQDSSRLKKRAGDAVSSSSQASGARGASFAALAAMGAAKLISWVSGIEKGATILSPQCDAFKSSLEKVKIFDIRLKDLPG